MTNRNSKGDTPPPEGVRSWGLAAASDRQADMAEEVEPMEFELPDAGACAPASSAWRLNRGHTSSEGGASSTAGGPPPAPPARNPNRPSSVGALPIPRSALSRLSVGTRDGAARGEADGPVSPRAASSAIAPPTASPPEGADAEVTLTAPHSAFVEGEAAPSSPRHLPPPPPAPRILAAPHVKRDATAHGARLTAMDGIGGPAVRAGLLPPGAIPSVPHEPRSADPDGGSIDRILVGLDHVRWSVPDAKVPVTNGHSKANFAVGATSPPKGHTEPRLDPVVFNYPDEKTRVPDPPATEPVTLPPMPWQGRLKMGVITLVAIAGFVLFGWAVAELWLASPHGRRSANASTSVARATYPAAAPSNSATSATAVRVPHVRSDEPSPSPPRFASESPAVPGPATNARSESPKLPRAAQSTTERTAPSAADRSQTDSARTSSVARSVASSRTSSTAPTGRAAGPSATSAKNVPSSRVPLYNDLPFHTSSDRTGMP